MKILGFNYSLERSLPHDAKFMGMTDSDNLKIQLSDKPYPNERMIEVILHESIHAISNELELHLPERAALCLSASIYQILNDNGVDLNPLLKEIK